MKRTIRVRIAGRNPELSGFLRFLGFLILLFLMLSRLGTTFPAEAATSSPSAYTYEDWKHSLDRVAENLEKDGFHYSVNGGKGSYRKSKEKRRVTNCAIYVSWALQDAGIIKKGQVFWIDKGGAIRGKRKTCITKNNKLKILHPHKKRSMPVSRKEIFAAGTAISIRRCMREEMPKAELCGTPPAEMEG